MKRIMILTLALVLALSFFVTTSASNEKSDVKIVTDCSGAQVEIPSEINRIVVTSPAAVAFMTAMGLEEKIVGTHGSVLNHFWVYEFSDHFSEIPWYGKNPNAEEMIAASVDLIILKDASYAEELRKIGIPAVCFKYTCKDELYFALDMLGDIFGDQAKNYAGAWKEKLDSTILNISADLSAVSDDDKVKVYYVDSTGEAVNLYLTAGGGSFVDFWIISAGGNMVTSQFENLEQIDQETALILNPDKILICGWLQYSAKDALMSDPLWQEVPAVKNDQIYLMPTSFVSYDRFAVELPLMLDYTANVLYPELHEFGGINELREFYEQFYGRTFSDSQLENMLLGLNPDGTKMGE